MCTKLHGVKSGKYEIHHIVPVIRAEPMDQSLTTAICQTRSTNTIARPKSPTNSSVLPLFSHFNLWSDFCLWIFLTLKRFLCWLIDFPFSYAVGKSWRERERLQKVGEEEVGKWHWGWKGRGGGLTKMEVKSLTITNLIFSWDQSTKLWLNVGRDFIKNLYRVLASFLLSSLLFFCVIWWYIRGEKTFLKSPHLKNTPLRSQYDQKVERSFRKRNSTLICDIYTYK